MIGNYNVDMSPIAQGLNMRAANIENEKKRQQELEIKKLVSKSIPTLREGSYMRQLFEADPQTGAFLAKTLNIPLDNLSDMEQFSQNVRAIAGVASKDPAGAVQIAQKLRDDRAQIGLNTDQYDKFLQTYQENPDMAIRALNVMDEALNKDLIEAQSRKERQVKLQERELDIKEARLKSGVEDPSGLRQFEGMTEGLSQEDKDQARRIALGLAPRAVGSAAITTATQDLTRPVAESESFITGATTTAKKDAEDLVKYKSNIFDSINSNSRMLSKYNFAIKQLNDGANTGPVIRSLPNLKEQSILVDVVRKEIGMELLGSGLLGVNPTDKDVQFALETAVPDNLMPDALKRELERRSSILQDINAAQEEYYRLIEEEGMTKGDILKLAKQKRQEQQQQEKVATQSASSKYKIEVMP
jgi:hypothetical protein